MLFLVSAVWWGIHVYLREFRSKNMKEKLSRQHCYRPPRMHTRIRHNHSWLSFFVAVDVPSSCSQELSIEFNFIINLKRSEEIRSNFCEFRHSFRFDSCTFHFVLNWDEGGTKGGGVEKNVREWGCRVVGWYIAHFIVIPLATMNGRSILKRLFWRIH